MSRDTSKNSGDRFDRSLDRRTLLKGAAALGAGAALTACGFRPGPGDGWGHGHGHGDGDGHGHGGPPWGRVLPPGSRPFPRIPEGTDMMPEIEHVVVLMMENHSYDSYFGACLLYTSDAADE